MELTWPKRAFWVHTAHCFFKRVGLLSVFLNSLKRRSLLLFAVLAVFLPGAVCAQALDAATAKADANILKKAEYLQDPTGRLSFRDLLRPEAEKAFKPYRSATFSSAEELATHWFRFDVEARRGGALDAAIYFTDPNITRMQVFRQVVGANADVFRYDPRNGVDNTVTTQFGVGLPVTVKSGQRRSIYVSISGPKLSGQLQLWQRGALDKHLSVRAGLRIALLAVTLAAALVALVAVWRRARFAWLTLAFASLVYGAYYWINTSAYFTPAVFGSLDLPLFLVAVFAASVTFFCAGLLRREVIAQHILWWSLLLGCAMIASTLMGLFLPGPAKLFSYVLIAALSGVCLFIAVALLTFKNADAFRLKALLAALFAASIALMPRWSIDLTAFGDLPSFLIVGTLLFAAIVCVLTPADAKLIAVDKTRVATDIDIFATPPEAVSADEQDTIDADVDEGEDTQHPVATPEDVPQTAATDDGYGEILARAQAAKTMPALPIAPATVVGAEGIPTAIDALTGVFTSATIEAVGQKTLAQAQRYERSHTAIMLRIKDFDDLKQTLGQPTSDRAAKLMAVTAMRELRESDALGRLKDDTFLAVLPETDFKGAVSGLARTQANIVERTLPTRAGMKQLNIEFSATSLRANDVDFQQVIDRLEHSLADDVSEVREERPSSNVEAAE